VGGELVQGIVGVPNLFQPILSSDAASGTIEALIFEGLVRYDESMERVGLLAREWEISPDQLRWTFHLKEGVKWHDGKPFTAYDVEFTFRTVAFDEDYPGPRRSSLSLLEDIQVMDEHTICFILKRPFGPFMNSLGIGIIPRHLFDPEHYEGEGEPTPIAEMYYNPYNWRPVGTGPWQLEEWVEGETITLVRNPHYHQRNLPFIAKLRFKLFDNVTEAVDALLAGEIDLQPIPASAVPAVKEALKESHNLFESMNLAYDYLGFNHREQAFGHDKINPWTDLAVRQAVAMALDRQEMIDIIYNGRGTVMDSSIPPVSWAYAGDEAITRYQYDPAQAIHLLAQAGWVLRGDIESEYRWFNKGTPEEPRWQMFEFDLALQKNSPVRKQIALLTQQYLHEVGIKVNLRILDWRELLNDVVIPGSYHMVLMGWNLPTDPDSFNIFHSDMVDSLNDGAYSNPRVDQLLVLGRETVDIQARKAIYASLQAELSRDLPYVFLFTTWNMTAVHKRVRGVTVGAQGLLFPERWYIAR
jgi:peptide/nickel transport system substrate-binding protein